MLVLCLHKKVSQRQRESNIKKNIWKQNHPNLLIESPKDNSKALFHTQFVKESQWNISSYPMESI